MSSNLAYQPVPGGPGDGKYTYQDYKTWGDGCVCEIINGKIYDMTPAPRIYHQLISSNLHYLFKDYLKDKTCKVICAPLDVKLPLENETFENTVNVVQPDILVVCDDTKLGEFSCNGAPDLIIEILSPSTAYKDTNEKYNLYEKAGVKEYWIVHPDRKTVEVNILGKDLKYENPIIYIKTAKIKVSIFNDLIIDLIKNILTG